MIWLILCAAVFVIDICLFSFNQYGWSLILLLINAGLAYAMIPEVSTQVASTPLEVVIYYALVYAGVGVVISSVKWLLYIRKMGSEIGAIRASFDIAKSILNDNTSRNEFQRVATYITEIGRHYPSKYPSLYHYTNYDSSQTGFSTIKDHTTLIEHFTPSAKGQVDKIAYWVGLWPFVIVDTAFRDILVNFGKHVAALISRLFGGITRAIIRSAIGNVDPIPKPNTENSSASTRTGVDIDSVLNETASRG